MALLTIPELIEGAKCFQCQIPPGMQWPVANYLMKLLISGGTPPPVDQLANEAICFFLCVPTGLNGSIMIFLLNYWLENGVHDGITTEDGDLITDEDGNILVPE